MLVLLTLISAAASQLIPWHAPTALPAWQAALGNWGRWYDAALFTAALLLVVGGHELAHLWRARRHGLAAGVPYLLPAPTLVGTLGGVMALRERPRTRAQLLDIALAGPIVGATLATAAMGLGLELSTAATAQFSGDAPQHWGNGYILHNRFVLGTSLLMWAIDFAVGPESAWVVLHPVALAGWTGGLMTSVSLMPAAQLDGGHIAYALFGRRHVWFAAAAGMALAMTGLLGVGGKQGWVWAVVGAFVALGSRHHPGVDMPQRPVSRKQQCVGALGLVVWIAAWVPIPVQAIETAAVVMPMHSGIGS